MSQPLQRLHHLADGIADLSTGDLHRLARILVRHSPMEASDLLDGIQGEFLLIAGELAIEPRLDK